MNIEQIRNIVTIADEGSISRAAQKLFVSQPALSQQVSRAEREVGFAIFARQRYGVELTPQGELMLRDARRVLKDWRRLQETCAQIREKEPRHMNIAVGPRVYSTGLFEKVAGYFALHPELEVTFLTVVGADFVQGLQRREIDVVIDREQEGVQTEGLFIRPLLSERQCVLTARGDGQLQGRTAHLQEISGRNLITGRSGSMEDRNMALVARRYGISFARIYRTDGLSAMMDLVRSGQGVLLGPESFADYYHVRAVPLEPEMQVSLDLICLEERRQEQEIDRFIRALLQQLGVADEGK